MKRIKINSEAVSAVGYDKLKKILRIRFAEGNVFDYQGVPVRVFKELFEAESIGRYINWEVKPNYEFTEISGWK